MSHGPRLGQWLLSIINDPQVPDKILGRAIAAAAILGLQESAETIWVRVSDRESPDVREVGIRALGELKFKNALNDLKLSLKDPSIRISLAAADSLGKMDDSAGYDIAAKYMDYSDWFIRKLAAEALGSIGTDEALNRLNVHLVTETSPMATSETEIAINRISMKRMTKPERFACMQQLLDSENRFVSRWAHKQMLKEFPDECIPIFRERSLKAPGRLKEAAEIYLLLGEEHQKAGGSLE